MEELYKEAVTRQSVIDTLKRLGDNAHHSPTNDQLAFISNAMTIFVIGGGIYYAIKIDNSAELATKAGFRDDNNRNDSPLPYFSYLVTPNLCLDALLRRHGNSDMNTLTVKLSSWKANPYLFGTKGYCAALSNALKESMSRLLERHLCNSWRGRQLFRWPS